MQQDDQLDALVARLSGLAADVPVVSADPTGRETAVPTRPVPSRTVPPRAVPPRAVPTRPIQPRHLTPPAGAAPPAALPAARVLPPNTPVHSAPRRPAAATAPGEPFIPKPPRSIAETRISEPLIEAIVLKFLLYQGTVSGRGVAEQTCLPFAVIEKLLTRLKTEQLVVYRGTAAMGDYDYQLTARGCETAMRLLQSGSYIGAVPVHLDDYTAAVRAQSISHHRPTIDDINAVFHDLRFDPTLLNRIGQALDAGKGFFLYGKPGNGKTSIAERVSGVFGEFVWIPRALGIGSDVIRMLRPLQPRRGSAHRTAAAKASIAAGSASAGRPSSPAAS